MPRPGRSTDSAPAIPKASGPDAQPGRTAALRAEGGEAATQRSSSPDSDVKAGQELLKRGTMRVLIFLSGGGSIVSGAAEPVEFKAGDSLPIPAALEGAVRFSQDTEYLIVTV